MHVPVWLILGGGLVVCAWGAYRVRLGLRSDQQDEHTRPRRGLHAMARRTHLFVGIVYLLLGAALIATSLGWSPLGSVVTRSSPDAPMKLVPVEEVFPSKGSAAQPPAQPASPQPASPQPPEGSSAGASPTPAAGNTAQPN